MSPFAREGCEENEQLSRIGCELIRDRQPIVALYYAKVLLRDADFAERRATLLNSQPRSERQLCMQLNRSIDLCAQAYLCEP